MPLFLIKMFYGQHGEDQYIKTLFPEGYIGTCVDVGAYDGISMSNTLHFEQRGWRCLCIEPIDEAYEKCEAIRKQTVKCCASDRDKEDQDFTVFYLGKENSSAISSLEPDQRLIQSHHHLITDKKTYKVPVRSLTSLLDEFHYPINIDFISIDTENTELDVLKGLDLIRYNVRLFVIEDNFNEPFCEEYLRQYNYQKINRIGVNNLFLKIT